MTSVAKILIVIGAIIMCLGILFSLFGKIGVHLGRLPGDIHMSLKNGSIHFPIITSIIVSIALTIIINVILWLIRR